MLALTVSGCANGVGAYDPVAWWHHLEGGRIAEARPQPPGIDAPYPNLASIPSKPQALSAAARAAAAGSLLRDRANGTYALAQPMPIPAPGPAPAAPAAPAADAMGARMAAVGASRAAPSPSPAPSPSSAPSPSPASAATPATAPAIASLDVPAAPPPPPDLPGVPWLTRPTPPPAAPRTPPPPPPQGTGKPVAVSFARGSAVLSADDDAALRQLAAARAASVVAVTGFGEAVDTDPAVQIAALRLAWARASAIAAALRRDGVPDTAMTVAAFATGGGGAARLLPSG